MGKLLTTSNPKIQKGTKRGYFTTIQHFAPSKLSGVNVCLDATPECIRFCLNKAGRGGIFKAGEKTNIIQEARKARTRLFLNDFHIYQAQLIKEIGAHFRRAIKLDLWPCVRLNGTSDLAWEEIFAPLFWRFEDVQFYDYTKSFDRMMRFLKGPWPTKNYHLTFSRSELNDDECDKVFDAGGSVAAVFDDVPATFRGRAVYPGDDDDLRFLDPKGVWIGLKAKGKLAREESSFKVKPWFG
jgi:hypothetical protein